MQIIYYQNINTRKFYRVALVTTIVENNIPNVTCKVINMWSDISKEWIKCCTSYEDVLKHKYTYKVVTPSVMEMVMRSK